MKNIVIASIILSLIGIDSPTISTFCQNNFIERSTLKEISVEDSIKLTRAWSSLLSAIVKKDYTLLKKLSLSNVFVMSNAFNTLGNLPSSQMMSIDSFVTDIIPRFYDGHFINVLSDSTYRLRAFTYPDRKPKNVTLLKGQKLTLYNVYFIDIVPRVGKYRTYREKKWYNFRFVKQRGEFKLWALDVD